MNKPDSTGESLESILASIRRSLSEQSTGMLEDETATPATLLPSETDALDDTDVPRLFGGTGGAPSEAGERELLARLEDDPPPPSSTLAPAPAQEEPLRPAPVTAALGEPPPPASAVGAAIPPGTPNDAPRDPLWFMKGWGDSEKSQKKDNTAPAPSPDVPLHPAAAGDAPLRPALSGAKSPPAAEPKPARAEIVRGPLPPFFGSSAEVAKVEVAPVPDLSPGASPMPPLATEPPGRAGDGAPRRGAMLEPPRAPAWPPVSPEPIVPAAPLTPPPAREGLLNGKASPLAPSPAASIPGPAPAAAGTAEALPHVRGLEAMVAELLRPMLRRWLDENMPRLVSAALKAEADVMSRRDPKKP